MARGGRGRSAMSAAAMSKAVLLFLYRAEKFLRNVSPHTPGACLLPPGRRSVPPATLPKIRCCPHQPK
jgi:hypothetical protein